MLFNSVDDLNLGSKPSKLEEVVEVLELTPKDPKKKEEKEEIKKAIEQEALEKNELEALEAERVKEEDRKQGDLQIKIPTQVYYNYISPSKRKEIAANYTFTPTNVQIFRVPQTVLGYNVLGCAFLGTNVIYIRDTLYGDQFEEVKRHEINHIVNPFMTECQIRSKTKAELPFEASFH